MLAWTMQKQEVELRGIIRVFRIPSGVVLDRIKAKFRDEESILTISMPKSVRGISGVGIVEVKGDKVDKGRPKDIAQIASAIDREVPERIETKEEKTGQIVDRELSKKETGAIDQAADKKGEEIKEPKVESMAEITRSTVAEEFLQREAKPIPEESEEEKVEKKDKPDKVDGAEKLETTQIATDEVPERDERPETEDHATEKATQKVDAEAAMEEPKKEDRAERDVDGTQLTREPKRKELSELNEQVQKQTSNDKVECETPLGLQNQEAKDTFQADNDHVPEQADQSNKEEVQLGVKEEDNQIQEAEKREVKYKEGKVGSEINDSSEEGKKKEDVSEVLTQDEKKKKPVSRRRKLCAPCAIAGSTILASVVVIFINWFKARKR